MTNFNINFGNEIRNKWPSARIYTIEADVTAGATPEALRLQLEKCADSLKDVIEENEVCSRPAVAATLDFLKAMGVTNPTCSAERLTLEVLRGKDVISGSILRDIATLVSLRSGYCISFLDASTIAGKDLRFGLVYEDNKESIGLKDDNGLVGDLSSVAAGTLPDNSSVRVLIVLYYFGEEESPTNTIDYLSGLLTEYAQATNINTNIFHP